MFVLTKIHLDAKTERGPVATPQRHVDGLFPRSLTSQEEQKTIA